MIDIDASWDGKGSLDDHRMEMLETLEQPGFGIHAKPKTPTETPQHVTADDEEPLTKEPESGE